MHLREGHVASLERCHIVAPERLECGEIFISQCASVERRAKRRELLRRPTHTGPEEQLPPLSWSMFAAMRATSNGLRYGRMTTVVPISIRRVKPVSHPSVVNGS
jgi:hypothetical protein